MISVWQTVAVSAEFSHPGTWTTLTEMKLKMTYFQKLMSLNSGSAVKNPHISF